MTSSPTCLYRGFDGLDVSFLAMLSSDVLAELREARAMAEKAGHAIVGKFGPGRLGLMIAETGARGGYKFRGDSGYLGATWFIKDRMVPEPGNIRISVHSETLAILGIEKTVQLLQENLVALGATYTPESVSRVDYAFDFLMPADFQLDAQRFSCHSRSAVREHAEARNTTGNSISISWSGRRTTSVTIGKMPGRQLIFYDKTLEIVSSLKQHWLSIWGLNASETKKRVWRIEIRFGKSYLSEKARIFTYDQMHRRLRSELISAIQAIRYLERIPTDENVTRVQNHLIWQALLSEISMLESPRENQIDPPHILEQRRLRAIAHRRKMVGALIPGIVALEGYDLEEGRQVAGQIAASCANELSAGRPKEFLKKASDNHSRFFLSPIKSPN